MKQVLIFILITIAAISGARDVSAQSDERSQARSIFKAYENSESLSFNAVIKMYTIKQPLKIIDQVNAAYVIQNHMYYCKIGSVEIINNKESSFLVDHDDKIVLVGKKHIVKSGKGQAEEAYNLESMFFHIRFDSVQLQITPKGALRQLDITGMSDTRILKYQLIYNPSTFLINQLVVDVKPEDTQYGKGNLRVEINYSQYQKQPKPEATFSGDKFVTINGRNAALKPAYASYQLVNQL